MTTQQFKMSTWLSDDGMYSLSFVAELEGYNYRKIMRVLEEIKNDDVEVH